MKVMIKTIDNNDYTVYTGSDESFVEHIKDYAKPRINLSHIKDKWVIANHWNQYSWETKIGTYFSFHDTEGLQ